MVAVHEFEARLRPLWLRAQAGDERAYREALMLASVRLRAYFVRRLAAGTNSPDEAEDLVQETLLAMHRQRGTCDPALPISAWLYAIARHKLIDALRRSGRVGMDSLDDLPDEELAAPAGDVGAGRDVARLLATLPASQASSIRATRLAGYTTAEAAVGLGFSESAVKVNVHRGLKRLSQLIRGVP